jgi:hypothetical protein
MAKSVHLRVLAPELGQSLLSVHDFLGYWVRATDGIVGQVDGIFFDDQHWTVRYLVVRTGKWWSKARELISPCSVRGIDSENHGLWLNLTREQIKNSPDVDSDQPVSRQKELEFQRYYRWPYFWTGAGIWGVAPTAEGLVGDPYAWADVSQDAVLGPRVDGQDPHLRSVKEVLRYRIEATDAYFGRVNDVLVDLEDWSLPYLVIDTGTWIPGKTVLVSPRWVEAIETSDRRLRLSLSRAEIQSSHFYRKD